MELTQLVDSYINARKRTIPPRRVWINIPLADFVRAFVRLAQFYDFKITGTDRTIELNAQMQKLLVSLHKYLTQVKDNRGLFLVGNYGTGKTMTAFALAELLKLLSKGFTYKLITAEQVIELYLRANEQRDDYNLNQIRYADLLIVDDLGNESTQVINLWGNKIRPIENLLAKRYQQGRWTWITSNYGLNELSEIYSGYLIDRFKQMFYFFPFNWQSYRK